MPLMPRLAQHLFEFTGENQEGIEIVDGPLAVFAPDATFRWTVEQRAMLADFSLEWSSPDANTDTREVDHLRHVTTAVRKDFKRWVLRGLAQFIASSASNTR